MTDVSESTTEIVRRLVMVVKSAGVSTITTRCIISVFSITTIPIKLFLKHSSHYGSSTSIFPSLLLLSFSLNELRTHYCTITQINTSETHVMCYEHLQVHVLIRTTLINHNIIITTFLQSEPIFANFKTDTYPPSASTTVCLASDPGLLNTCETIGKAWSIR